MQRNARPSREVFYFGLLALGWLFCARTTFAIDLGPEESRLLIKTFQDSQFPFVEESGAFLYNAVRSLCRTTFIPRRGRVTGCSFWNISEEKFGLSGKQAEMTYDLFVKLKFPLEPLPHEMEIRSGAIECTTRPNNNQQGSCWIQAH